MPSIIRSICIPLDLYQKLQKWAKEERKSTNKLIKEILSRAVIEKERKMETLEERISKTVEKAISDWLRAEEERRRPPRPRPLTSYY